MLVVRCLGVIHSGNLWMKFTSLTFWFFFLMIIEYWGYQYELSIYVLCKCAVSLVFRSSYSSVILFWILILLLFIWYSYCIWSKFTWLLSSKTGRSRCFWRGIKIVCDGIFFFTENYCEGYLGGCVAFFGGGRFFVLFCFFLTLEHSCECILQFTPFFSPLPPSQNHPQTAVLLSSYELKLILSLSFSCRCLVYSY